MTQLHFLSDSEMPIEPPKISPHESKYQRFKRKNNYRKADNACRCENCNNMFAKSCNGKIYYKCMAMGLSNCPATDIRKSYVCDMWEV